MRAVQITGPVSGRTFTAHDTGETWNGSPVLAFTSEEIRAYIAAGDGEDSNGYGLRIEAGAVLDRFDEWEADPVPTLSARLENAPVTLYVPAGRIWETVQ